MVAAVLAVAGLYFASAVSWSAIWEIVAGRWLALVAWRQQRLDRREESVEQQAEGREGDPSNQQQLLIPGNDSESAYETHIEKPRRFGLFFIRRKRAWKTILSTRFRPINA